MTEPLHRNPFRPGDHHRETFAEKIARIRQQVREWKGAADPYAAYRRKNHKV